MGRTLLSDAVDLVLALDAPPPNARANVEERRFQRRVTLEATGKGTSLLVPSQSEKKKRGFSR